MLDFTYDDIKNETDPGSYQRGQEYFKQGMVESLKVEQIGKYAVALSGEAKAREIWAGIAPGGVGSSSVYCHRSQNTQVKGHSRPVRKIVWHGTSSPSSLRSSSCWTPIGRQASNRRLAGRSLRIR